MARNMTPSTLSIFFLVKVYAEIKIATEQIINIVESTVEMPLYDNGRIIDAPPRMSMMFEMFEPIILPSAN